MFCPKCSQPQPAEDLRFCPRCGFQVAAVKELVGQEEARGHGGDLLPAQKDVVTGGLLMFAGGVIAVLWGFMGPRWPAEVMLPQAYFILGGTLAVILTLFHPLLRTLEGLFSGGEPAPYPQARRDGINLGALLMFVGTLKAMALTAAMPPGNERGLTTLLFMAVMLLLVFLLRPILRFAHGLFFKDAGRADSQAINTTARLDSAGRDPALPPAHSIPVENFAPRPADTADMVAPPSVAEGTTRKLNDL